MLIDIFARLQGVHRPLAIPALQPRQNQLSTYLHGAISATTAGQPWPPQSTETTWVRWASGGGWIVNQLTPAGYQGSSRTTTGSTTSSSILDERLETVAAAVPSIFSHGHVLDIGCNDGRIAVDIALRFRPAFVTGLDPDGALIAKAKSHLSFRWSRLGPNGELDYFPASAVEKFGHVPYPLAEDAGEGLPHCVGFLNADFVDWKVGENKGQFRTVLMLSVSKWIHLVHGDYGVHPHPHKSPPPPQKKKKGD